MVDLSIKGIARKYLGISGNFSVLTDVLRLSHTNGSRSLRSSLESLARHEERGTRQEECISPFSLSGEIEYYYRKFTVAFEQTWTHIRVRIKLINDAAISDDALNALKNTWSKGIQNIWNNKWGCALPGESTCRLTFEIQYVTENEHRTVFVVPGVVSLTSGKIVRANTGKWHTFMSGDTAAHEYGHYIGHGDHYIEEDVCKGRKIEFPGSVMDNNSDNVPSGLVAHLANNIGSNIVSIK